jgi:predicted secreted protein
MENYNEQNQNYQQTDYQQSNGQVIPPTSYLVGAILATLFCCLPFGIPAIVNAAKVESRWYAGDKYGAIDASNKARSWMWASIIAGGVFGLLYFIVVILGLAGGALLPFALLDL